MRLSVMKRLQTTKGFHAKAGASQQEPGPETTQTDPKMKVFYFRYLRSTVWKRISLIELPLIILFTYFTNCGLGLHWEHICYVVSYKNSAFIITQTFKLYIDNIWPYSHFFAMPLIHQHIAPSNRLSQWGRKPFRIFESFKIKKKWKE